MEHVQLELPDDNEIIPADQQESEEDCNQQRIKVGKPFFLIQIGQ